MLNNSSELESWKDGLREEVLFLIGINEGIKKKEKKIPTNSKKKDSFFFCFFLYLFLSLFLLSFVLILFSEIEFV